jgi:hypothetical protein
MPRLRILGAVVLALAAIIGLVLYLYRPSAAAKRSLERLGQASTAHFNAHLNLANTTSTEQLLGEAGTVEVELKGVWRKEDGPDSIATDLILATQTESVSVKVQGDVRLIGDKLYWQITKTPQSFPILMQLKDQWIVMPRGATPEGDDTLAAAPVLTSVTRQGVETIDGVTTVHYTATASAETMVSLMDGLAGVLGTSLSEAQINQIKESVAQATSVPLDLWVKRWSSEPKQLRVSLAVPGGNTVQFTIQFTALNQPVTIDVPEGAITLQEMAQRQVTPTPVPIP